MNSHDFVAEPVNPVHVFHDAHRFYFYGQDYCGQILLRTRPFVEEEEWRPYDDKTRIHFKKAVMRSDR